MQYDLLGQDCSVSKGDPLALGLWQTQVRVVEGQDVFCVDLTSTSGNQTQNFSTYKSQVTFT